MPEDQKISELDQITENVPANIEIPVFDPDELLEENQNKRVAASLLFPGSGLTIVSKVSKTSDSNGLNMTGSSGLDLGPYFDSVDWNNGNYWSSLNNRWEFTESKVVLVGLLWVNDGIASNDRIIERIYHYDIDDNLIATHTMVDAGNANRDRITYSHTSAPISVSAGDYLTVHGKVFDDGSANILTGSCTWLMVDHGALSSELSEVNISDADFAAEPGNHYKYDATSQTANRTMTMPSPSAPVGSKFRVSYEGVHATHGLVAALNGNTVIDKLLGRTVAQCKTGGNPPSQTKDFGVSSISRTEAGRFDVNLTFSFSDENFATVASATTASAISNFSIGARSTLANKATITVESSTGSGNDYVNDLITVLVLDSDGIDRIAAPYTEIEFEKINSTTWIAREL